MNDFLTDICRLASQESWEVIACSQPPSRAAISRGCGAKLD